MTRIIQASGFLGNATLNLDKKARTDLDVSFSKDALPKLATKATSSILDELEKKISGQGAVRAVNHFDLLYSFPVKIWLLSKLL